MNNTQFDSLARQYMDTVFRLAFSMTKSKADAEDVTQNVLLSLYRMDKAFESDAHIKNWLVRVTVNECKKLWRSPWNQTTDYDEYSKTLPFEEERFREVYDAIMALNRQSRTAVVLHYYEGYSAKEIAEILKIPENTVYTRLARARKKLKAFLTEEA